MLLGLLVAIAMIELDLVFGLKNFQSEMLAKLGWTFLALGAALRFWATHLFYQKQMRVIATRPQAQLLTTGPYKYSRNPLYLGLILIFAGAALLAGSVSALLLTLAIFIVLSFWIRVEERQLAEAFGEQYAKFQSQIRRWL